MNDYFFRFDVNLQSFTALSEIPQTADNGVDAGSSLAPSPKEKILILNWGSTADISLINNKLFAFDEARNKWVDLGTSLPTPDGQYDGRRTVFLQQEVPFRPRLCYLSILNPDYFEWKSLYAYSFSELISALWCRIGLTDLSAKLLIPYLGYEWLAGSIKVGVFVDYAELAGLLNVRFAFAELAGILGIKYLHTDLSASFYLRPPYTPLPGATTIRRSRWSSLWSRLGIGTKPLDGLLTLRRLEFKALLGELNIAVFTELLSSLTIAQFGFSSLSSSLGVAWLVSLADLASKLNIRALGYDSLISRLFVPRYVGALSIRGRLYVPRYLGEILLDAYLNIQKLQAVTEIEFASKTSDIELLLHSLKIELEMLKWLIKFRKEGLG